MAALAPQRHSLTHLVRNDLVYCARPTLAGARFCLTRNQITRQLGLKQHHARRRNRTDPALLGPFAILLLSIAIFPLISRQHWERHYQKLCALLAATTCGYYVLALHGTARVQHAAGEYATFIVVVGTFFVVAGAIHLHIPRPASPLANVTFLFGGSILANFIGTIGASMLLLRPFLHMNRGRGSAMHVAFFIFTIGNLGGALLPVGPPLFLGYIKGVPSLWTALHCWPQWLTATAALLGIFFVADTIARSRGPAVEVPATRFHCYGKWNFGGAPALLLILVFVPNGVREPSMLMVAVISYFFTPQRVFEANAFSWRPLIEVAWIFLGIFGTMIACSITWNCTRVISTSQ